MTAVAELASTSAAVGASASRLAKRDALAALLRRLEPGEVAIAVGWLSGELAQRQVGVGWAVLRELPGPADAARAGNDPVQVADLDAALDRVKAATGAGSTARRAAELGALFARLGEQEHRFVRALLGGELRQGALAGVMADAVAAAAGLPAPDVRRAVMLHGSLPAVAAIALTAGAAGLAGVGLQVGRPVAPMLAQPATGVADALGRAGEAVVEWKLDGARIQVHRDGDDVGIWTRTLDDVTARLPEVVAAARALPGRTAVLDGEAIALRPDGTPEPFQVTASRFGRRGGGGDGPPLHPYWFDLLHLDGTDLLDRPLRDRSAALDGVADPRHRPQRLVTADPAAAQAFLAATLARRHEGVVVKDLASPYEAGRRGGAWRKVKPVLTVDLVVLAAEWGSGRRRGWLSNLHLGARRDETGDAGAAGTSAEGFVMLGKTFKGLTDATLAWQTARFAELALDPGAASHVVAVRPEQVVEIAFDGLQTSSRYPGGVALRFARVVRYRDDKTAAQADTLAAVRAVAGMPAAVSG